MKRYGVSQRRAQPALRQTITRAKKVRNFTRGVIAFIHFNHYGGEAALLSAYLVNLDRLVTSDQIRQVHHVLDPVCSTAQAGAIDDWARELARCFGITDVVQQCLAYVVCFAGGHRLGRCPRPPCRRAYVDTARQRTAAVLLRTLRQYQRRVSASPPAGRQCRDGAGPGHA